MKIVTAQGPAPVEGALNDKTKSARDKAVEAFLGKQAAAAATTNQSQATPVANPTSVSAEDLSAIRPSSANPAEQNTIAEGTSAEPTPPAATPSEATQKTEAEQSLSPRYAHLARQEKALRARDAAIKAEKVELQRQKEALEAEKTSMQGQYVPKERLTRETLAVLSEMGIDFNTLSQQAPSTDPELARRDATISKLQGLVEDLTKKVEGTQKSFEENQQNSYTQAVAMIRQEANSLVKTDPNFATIKATGQVNDVVELIQKTFEEGLDEDHPKGTLLSVDEACQIVEDELTEQYTKVARLEKIQKRLNLAAKASTPTPPAQQPNSQSQGSRPTLTNTMTGAPKKEYTAKQRAMFAAQYGPNWQEKVSG